MNEVPEGTGVRIEEELARVLLVGRLVRAGTFMLIMAME